jgi:TonB-linked SusC/RagA family outer membrane protein
MKRLLLFFSVMFFGLSMSFGQRTVSGTIVDDTGDALIGASILVKGTSMGTVTDIDGKFSLQIPNDADVLVVSYTGYNSQEITVGNASVLDITMETDSELLEEVVVIAYGTQKRESLTGSLSTVTGEMLEAKPIATIDQLLQGQAPGLIVLGGSGQPGADAGSVVLRGPASIQGNNEPIYIMDGIQISASDFAALNPNDVESISVLRDASSTAIYGASGANGVIVINTRNGQAGETRVDYNVQWGFSNFTRDKFDMMNSTEKLVFEERARRGPGWSNSRNNPANASLSEAELLLLDSELDSLRGINTNWRDLIFQTGYTQTHNMRVSGGDENTTFYFSGNYYDEEGQVIDSKIQRGTLRANIEEKISDKVKIGMRATGGYADIRFIQSENGINLNNPFALAYLMNPYEQVRLDNGDYQFGSTGRNPFEEVEFNEDQQSEFKGIAQLYTDIEFIPHFTFSGRWGLDHTSETQTEYIDPDSRLGSTSSQGQQGQLDKTQEKRTWLTFSHVLNYGKIFNDRHNVDVIVGQELRRRHWNEFSFNAYGLTGGLTSPAGVTPGSADNPDFIPGIGGFSRKKSIMSFLSRVNYTLDDKYNVTLGARRDGSSVFGDNNRWGTFWNAGGSWIISRESFMDNVGAVSFLKLGVSYGTNGNSEGIGEQEKTALFVTGSYAGSDAFIPSATNPGNADLKWEVLKGINAFIEYGFFQDRISGSVAYYRNTTEDLFISQEVPRSAGSTSLTINAGSMKNEGVELDMAVKVLDGPVRLKVGGQFSYNDNVITDLGQVEEFEQGTSIIREGLALGTHYIEEWAGVDPANGNPLYVDEDGNITDNFNAVGPKADFGTYYAPWAGGVNLEVGYKGFWLTALGSWVYGNVLFNNQTFFQENPNFAQFNMTTVMNNPWLNPGDVTEVQRLDSPRQFSSKDLEDGSFFRLRNVQLSYDVPLKNGLLNTVKDIRIYVQAKNLLTLTKFTGFDPEIDNNIAQYEYPSSRAITFGLNVGF